MFLLEIENHDTGHRAIVCASSEESMERYLTERGWTRVDRRLGVIFEAEDADGCTYSAMEPRFPSAASLLPMSRVHGLKRKAVA